MNKEPALIVMAVVWVLNQLLGFINLPTPVDEGTLNTVAEFLIMVVGWLVMRRTVFTRNTIREAGLSPQTVQDRADNPAVPKLVEG